ncbi:hypothetical protein IAS59_002633 [Cryptococcus gattii]
MPPHTRPLTRNQIRLQQQHSRPPVDDRDDKVNFEILPQSRYVICHCSKCGRHDGIQLEKRTWLEHRLRDRLREMEKNDLPNLSSSPLSVTQTSPVVPPPSNFGTKETKESAEITVPQRSNLELQPARPSTLAVPPVTCESPLGPCSHVDSAPI